MREDAGRWPQLPPSTGRLRKFRIFFGTALAISVMLVVTASASALTLGVGWSGASSMEELDALHAGMIGAETYRVPLPPQNNNDNIVAAAARNGVTLENTVGGGPLPTGGARTAFISGMAAEVERYGYNGQFWAEHPGLPYRPIVTWEIWNEPNLAKIPPVEYGIFLNEVASSIQAASHSRAGVGTGVLAGGLLVWGNQGGSKGNWLERGPTTYTGALAYLREAYPYFGGIGSSVTGVAIHPYELDPTTFQPGYSRLQAFEYAVNGFHNQLAALPESPESPELSLAITEAGWPAEGEYAVSVSEQANLLKGAVNYSRSHAAALHLTAFDWYDMADVGGTSSWEAHCGLLTETGVRRPSWFAFLEEAGVVPSPVIAMVSTAGDLLGKEHSIESEWLGLSEGIASTSVATDRIHGPLVGELAASGDFFAKQGSIGAEWAHIGENIASISVASDTGNGPLIGEVSKTGNAFVKQGSLGAPWTPISEGVKSIAVASDPVNGPLIGIVTPGGNFFAKEGSVGAEWVLEGENIASIAVASDPVNGPLIGEVAATGQFFAKEGSLGAPWTAMSVGIKSIAVASDPFNGPLIGEVATTGQFYAKEFSLGSPWVLQSEGPISSISMASDSTFGPLIAEVAPSGWTLAKEGTLASGWIGQSVTGSSISVAG